MKSSTLTTTTGNSTTQPKQLFANEYIQRKNEVENARVLQQQAKKIIIVIARQHPGETVSSFYVQGLIDFLLTDTKESRSLLQKYVFKIIPMVNPDGVIYGNFRCNLAGVDINRNWTDPNKILHPEAYFTGQKF